MKTTAPVKTIPSAATGISVTPGGSWANGSWVEITSSAPSNAVLAGLLAGTGGEHDELEVDVGIGGSGSESVLSTFRFGNDSATSTIAEPQMLLVPISGISGQRVSARARSRSGATTDITVSILYLDNPDNSIVTDKHLACVPSAANGVSITPSGSSWNNSNWAELTSGLSNPIAIAGLAPQVSSFGTNFSDFELEIGIGSAGSEVAITSVRGGGGATATSRRQWLLLNGIYTISASTRIAVRLRKAGTTATTWFVSLIYYDNFSLISTTPFNQLNWPIPQFKGKLNRGYAQNPILFQTLSTPIPNSQRDWPNPLIGRRNHTGWVDYYTIDQINFKPNGTGEFPSKIEKKRAVPGWVQVRPFYYQDEKPFNQNEWPNPELKFKPAITHIHNRKLDEPPTPEPFKIPNYPNPLLKKRINPSWIDYFSLEETFTHPIGSSTFDNPIYKVKPLALTWIQTRPNYYEEPPVVVFRQTSWPNPLTRKRLQGIVNRHFIDSPITGTPFNQNNWPLPLRKRIHPKWEDYYVIDENVPFTQLSFILPLRKSNFTPTWINPGILVTQAGTPIVPYDYPNPIIVKQHTKTWIDNLLQSTLDPGEGEKPFNQNDYPNPLIGLKLLHSGWIDIRKFYFDEPPLQIGQFDWPIFRATVRNATGYIYSQKQDENPPKFVSVDNLPLVKNVLGITWIDNPLIVITGPVLIKPFNQNDYPNPRLRIPYYNNFNIFRPTSLIPPFIKGRKICLDAGFTIFELEAALEEYEIKARADDFILNADGEECE